MKRIWQRLSWRQRPAETELPEENAKQPNTFGNRTLFMASIGTNLQQVKALEAIHQAVQQVDEESKKTENEVTQLSWNVNNDFQNQINQQKETLEKLQRELEVLKTKNPAMSNDCNKLKELISTILTKINETHEIYNIRQETVSNSLKIERNIKKFR